MNARLDPWLDEQHRQKRQLLLIIDSLAEPDPVRELFAADLMRDYVNLYLGTELADLADVGPWLIRLDDADLVALQPLLDAPERNWGWLASANSIDLDALRQHWQARMLIDDRRGQRALYRFQDNRVLARHLGALAPEQRAPLLGPLASVLCWDGRTWSTFDNPSPGPCPAPFATPWLELPEPADVSRQIRQHNLLQWLWQEHPTHATTLAEQVVLDDWLAEQLDQAEHWQWHALEQQRFLLQGRLQPALASQPFWTPRPAESPEQHFDRCQAFVAYMEPSHP
ncbi:DUF4123 domain-containing protein [Stutzerimonas balearica]|uniref:DUF4123 domain-containing protein n=1 Tax=Stutzerimonas balearica TaxID=74829 RepID=UPI00289A4C2F|nr:DUF4123 domain-containing protein [Stutzerimonas balearica]